LVPPVNLDVGERAVSRQPSGDRLAIMSHTSNGLPAAARDSPGAQGQSLSWADAFIRDIGRICGQFGMDVLRPQIDACAQMVDEGGIVDVAVVGRFKAGKSSFLKAVAIVDVEVSSLRPYQGVRFVDTPGLGSVYAHNTRTSMEWLPRVGAALLAVSIDHPLSEYDIDLLKDLDRHTPEVSILLTKAVIHEPKQPDVKTGRVFDTPLEVIWFLVPMWLFGSLVRRHLLRRLPWEVDKNLHRLAGQWSEAIGRSVDDLARQAQDFIEEELTTVEGLVAKAEDQRPAIAQGLATLDRLDAAIESKT
jgi:hypothetical protein